MKDIPPMFGDHEVDVARQALTNAVGYPGDDTADLIRVIAASAVLQQRQHEERMGDSDAQQG